MSKSRKVRRTVKSKEHHTERRVQASKSAEKADRYAGLKFFDPTAPRPVVQREPAYPITLPAHVDELPEDVRESFAPIEQVVERGPEPTAVTLDAENRCNVCHVIVNMRDKLPHDYWCPWWDSPEGQAASAPF